MAGAPWWESSPGLRQVFPALVNAASQRLDTASVWGAIKDAANNIASNTLGIRLGRDPSEDEIAAASSQILSGVTITDVNQARAAAGAMVSAHDKLVSRDPGEQILGDAIARPPWAQTSFRNDVQEQYRIRVQRSITHHGFTDNTFEEWSTYDLSGPITNTADALSTADALFGNSDYNRNVEINGTLDYIIEAI